jgi:hypothetical protein
VHDEVGRFHTGHPGQSGIPAKGIEVKTRVGVDNARERPGGPARGGMVPRRPGVRHVAPRGRRPSPGTGTDGPWPFWQLARWPPRVTGHDDTAALTHRARLSIGIGAAPAKLRCVTTVARSRCWVCRDMSPTRLDSRHGCGEGYSR